MIRRRKHHLSGGFRLAGMPKPIRPRDVPMDIYEEVIALWAFGHRTLARKDEILEARIIARSESGIWTDTVAEWSFEFEAPGVRKDLVPDQDTGTCLCTHAPIEKHCHIFNAVNERWACVGSCCIENFMGIPVEGIIRGLERMEHNPELAMTEAVIGFARKHGWLTDWELGFCQNTLKKRKLTFGQMETRKKINRRITNANAALRLAPPGPSFYFAF